MNFKKILSFSFGPLAGALLGLISLPIATHIFSADDIGRITMLQIGVNFILLFFSLGLDQAYVREYHELKDKHELFYLTMLPGLLLLFMVIFITVSFFPKFLSYIFFDIASFNLSLIIVSVFIISYIQKFLSLIVRMEERGWAFSIAQFMPKFINLMMVIAYFFLEKDEFIYLLMANFMSLLIVFFIILYQTKNVVFGGFPAVYNHIRMINLLRFGVPLIFGGVAYWGLLSIDRIMLRMLSSFEELGIYSVTNSFASIATILQTVFCTIWAPMVYKWAAEGGKSLDRIDGISEAILAYIMLIFCGAGLLSPIIQIILPTKYAIVQYILVASLSAPLLYTLSETTVVGLGIMRKTGFLMLVSCISLLILLLVGYYLIPSYGAAGAASSLAIAFLLFLILRTEFSSYVWRRIPRKKLYMSTTLCVFGAVISALFGDITQYSFVPILWGGILIYSVLTFRHVYYSNYIAICNYLKNTKS